MKREDNTLSKSILSNIIKIMRDKDLKQSTLAERMGTTQSQISKKLSGELKISIDELSKIASALSDLNSTIRVIDLITYPDVYQNTKPKEREDVKAILQLELHENKRDQVLKLIFGDNNVEIFNK